MSTIFREPKDEDSPGHDYVKPGMTDIKVQLVFSLGLGISAFLAFCVSLGTISASSAHDGYPFVISPGRHYGHDGNPCMRRASATPIPASRRRSCTTRSREGARSGTRSRRSRCSRHPAWMPLWYGRSSGEGLLR